ncbi:hypothetical protein [Aquimarina pacifica]|uniref:hypothetical protein n=1 Tax=Aquimarina pacifica TaxID=1296415 RepID=UPI00046FE887|nr:hypothetical protein [Aquimarina pacifica]
MKKNKPITWLCMLCLALLSISCVEDVDLNQANDIVLTPVYEADFVYSKLNTEEFIDFDIDLGIIVPEIVVNDTLDYDILSSSFAVDNLEKVELYFEFYNSIEIGFTFDFIFLDSNGQIIGPSYSIPVNPGNGPDEPSVLSIPDPITLDPELIAILGDTKQLVTSIRVQNVSSSLQGILELKSKGTYFVKYDL